MAIGRVESLLKALLPIFKINFTALCSGTLHRYKVRRIKEV